MNDKYNSSRLNENSLRPLHSDSRVCTAIGPSTRVMKNIRYYARCKCVQFIRINDIIIELNLN
ncbi:MAG: hypothetical protein IKY79_05190 [Bacteroidales bacterium]|nr:hypothetical protein [Bacteroidales bacterium]